MMPLNQNIIIICAFKPDLATAFKQFMLLLDVAQLERRTSKATNEYQILFIIFFTMYTSYYAIALVAPTKAKLISNY